MEMNIIHAARWLSWKTGGVVVVNISNIAIQQIKPFKRKIESVRQVNTEFAIPDGRRFRPHTVVFN